MINLYTFQALIDSVPKGTLHLHAYDKGKGTNVGSVSRSKGGRQKTANEQTERIFRKYANRSDAEKYRRERASAKIAYKQAKRAILAHFLSVRWYVTDEGKKRFIPMDELTIMKNPLYLSYIERCDKAYADILKGLEKTYFERIF